MNACRHLDCLHHFLALLLLYRTSFTFALSTSTSSNSMSTRSDPDLRHFIGFDLGTSGARISVIQDTGKSPQDADSSASHSPPPPPFQEVYTQAIPWEGGAYDDPRIWMDAVTTLLAGAATGLPSALDSVISICVSGTSASCLLVDGRGNDSTGKVTVTRAPRMYNYDVVQSASSEPSDTDSTSSSYGKQALELLHQYAPEAHTARSPTGSLAKLLAWNAEQKLDATGEILCHQADYIALQLLSHDNNHNDERAVVSSDWHNCLKLGYDVRNLQWPEWIVTCLQAAGISDPHSVLPGTVVSPGAPMGYISSQAATRFGLPATVQVVGGTTDSNAAFFAATGSQPDMGTAVTSLGSTLAIKFIGSQYVEDASLGVYSHRFPSVLSNNGQTATWLVGGASNVGCAVLRQLEFSNDELDRLSQEIDPATDSPLSYYPLTRKGERFPAADSNKEPVLDPVPDNRRDFLHGILQGISDVERDGFLALGSLGASPTEPVQVWTCGGGSRNDMWTSLRQRRLRQAFGGDNNVNVARAENTEASYGAALLAAASFQ